jgi:2-methylcitrate dehydratase PrpD
MSTLAESLAERALEPVSEADADTLRTLTLTNVAAGAGDRGAMSQLLDRLGFDARRAPDAAFLSGAKLHARTQDDFYPEGRVHVGSITLAAAVALADSVGDRTLPALAAGYRVMCAIADAHTTEAQARGMRPSGVFGPFGAAATASVALGLDAAQTANAIALAAATSAGHNQAWISSTDEWFLEVGAAARSGVEAAIFTRAGVTAAPDAIEGRAGWASALFGDRGAGTLATALSERQLGPGVVAVKPYPVSGIAQVPTHLACVLHSDLDGEQPASIRVLVSPIEHAYPGSTNGGPFPSRSSALMSIAFCVACGALDGTVRLDRLENPAADGLGQAIATISVEPDPSLDENEAILIASMSDGREEQRSARAADILYPAWSELRDQANAVALRSEAPAPPVREAAQELDGAAPRAAVLRRLAGLD